ncbi:MAG: alpha/beta fold hydrolase [Chloroflexi bacterium]|nr:alpha/beta fold hydrolase [Chloroflexota bacterium]
MPTVHANGISMSYDTQGAGEPLVLVPYLAADQACYAFQIAEYAKHFTCISVDPRGAGNTDKPAGTYTTELFADDVAAFMQAPGLGPAHVAGLSLGAATGLWLAAKYPDRVKTLSLHSAWPKSDPFLRTVVEGWQVMARGFGSVADMVITVSSRGALPRSSTRPRPSTSSHWPTSCAADRRSRSRPSCVSRRPSSVMTLNRSWPGSQPPRWSPSAVLISSARCALPRR